MRATVGIGSSTTGSLNAQDLFWNTVPNLATCLTMASMLMRQRKFPRGPKPGPQGLRFQAAGPEPDKENRGRKADDMECRYKNTSYAEGSAIACETLKGHPTVVKM